MHAKIILEWLAWHTKILNCTQNAIGINGFCFTVWTKWILKIFKDIQHFMQMIKLYRIEFGCFQFAGKCTP